jgi:predicted transposase/invertase (TIGR01784 family)
MQTLQKLVRPVTEQSLALEAAEADGYEKGRAEMRIEIARNMKREELDPAFIAKVTELPLSEIERMG